MDRTAVICHSRMYVLLTAFAVARWKAQAPVLLVDFGAGDHTCSQWHGTVHHVRGAPHVFSEPAQICVSLSSLFWACLSQPALVCQDAQK